MPGDAIDKTTLTLVWVPKGQKPDRNNGTPHAGQFSELLEAIGYVMTAEDALTKRSESDPWIEYGHGVLDPDAILAVWENAASHAPLDWSNGSKPYYDATESQ